MLVGLGYIGYKYKTDRFFMRERVATSDTWGDSMEPTLHPGQEITGYKAEFEVGDIVSFDCYSDKCLKWGETKYDGHFIKRLIKIRDDGAWWIDGDNKENSFDSDYYGWLLPSEISDIWVIKVK